LSIGKLGRKADIFSFYTGMNGFMEKSLLSDPIVVLSANLAQGKGQFEKPGIKKTRPPLVNICYPMTQTECACFSGGAVYSRQYGRAL